LADYATLAYGSWQAASAGQPINLPGMHLVCHLKTDDIYLSVMFTDWGSHGAGGFSYERSTPTPANTPPLVSITSPTEGASFNTAQVTISASATDDGSVTNVTFRDGATVLGGTNNPPYTITTILSVGGHALTAVATDNLGLSATSSVVNITVNSANLPPTVTITNPADYSVFGNTDSVSIRTSATDSDGTIATNQVFNGSTFLRGSTSAAFNFNATGIAGNLALGTNTIFAVTTDNLGLTATSAPVHIVIARYLPAITNGETSVFLVPVATNLAAPLYGISPPGDRTRLFVLEQAGLVRVIENGILLPQAALDISNRVAPPLTPGSAIDERGLLGLAFHPGYTNPASPGYRTLYTYNSEVTVIGDPPTYPVPTTATNAYKNVVNEWKISAGNPNVIDSASRRPVISFGKTAFNHNGGTITFGPDGYMYLALGDGGDANDSGTSHIEPGGNAQNLSTPLGKFLRFDPLHPSLTPGSSDAASANGQYRIPATNPFQGAGQVKEIYALGVRNPYRFAFDRLNGELIHADVGQNNVEEIDRIVMGGNYGWPIKEGTFLFNRTNGPSGNTGTIGTPPGNNSPGLPAGFIDPISGTQGTLQYDHNDGISITGGFVYRGSLMPELYGKYIFGDLALKTSPSRADGRIFYADLQTGLIKAFPLPQFGGSAVLPNGLTVHGFGQDEDGEIYALVTNTAANGTGGIVYKIASFRLTTKVVGNTLDITWPVAGGRLQSQVNNPGAGLGTSWTDVAGSTGTNHVVVPFDNSKGTAFYRLVVP